VLGGTPLTPTTGSAIVKAIKTTDAPLVNVRATAEQYLSSTAGADVIDNPDVGTLPRTAAMTC